MTASNPPSEREQRLEAILVAYLEAVEHGQASSREELLGRHPEFAAELAAFLDNRRQIDALAGVPRDPDATLGYGVPADGPLGTVRYFGDYELREEIARGGMGVVY